MAIPSAPARYEQIVDPRRRIPESDVSDATRPGTRSMERGLARGRVACFKEHMVWGVLVIALATGILFCSFFTETWARDARDAAESMGPAMGPEPRLGSGAPRYRKPLPPSPNAPAER